MKIKQNDLSQGQEPSLSRLVRLDSDVAVSVRRYDKEDWLLHLNSFLRNAINNGSY